MIVEYTFRNTKRPLDDLAREQARNDGSEAAANRLDDPHLDAKRMDSTANDIEAVPPEVTEHED